MKHILLFMMLVGSLFASIGEITAINGKAFALRDGKSVPLVRGSKIEKRDTIKTLVNTRLKIVFVDHTVISLGQKTNFKVDKYDFNQNNQEARFSVSRGIFKSITGRIGHLNHSKYTLKTNNATIGVRGTIYIGRIEPNKESIACTSGEIVVYSNHGNVVVKKGEITTFTPFTAPSKPKRYKENNLNLFQGVVSSSDVAVIKEKVEKVLSSEKVKKIKAKLPSSENLNKTYTKVKVTEKTVSFGKNLNKTFKKVKEKIVNIKNPSHPNFSKVTEKVKQKVIVPIFGGNNSHSKQTSIKLPSYPDLSKATGNVKQKVIIPIFGGDNSHSKQASINLPSHEDISKVTENIKQGMQDMFGDFGSEHISKIDHEDEKESVHEVIDDKKSEYDELIQRGGSSKLHYIGKVAGDKIIDNNYNKVSLDFDLGKASVSGRVKFKKDNGFFSDTNFNTKIAGSVNPNGHFDFKPTSLLYSGKGEGDLSGEHLEQAKGTLHISKVLSDSGDLTFTTDKK